MSKQQTLIIFVFMSFVIYLLFKRTKKNIIQTVKTIKAMTRGYRNNNPGNIRLTFNKDGSKRFWTGEVEGTDKAFKTFKNMAYGYRAIFALLKEYISKGYNTIDKIIGRYAPTSENNTNAYVTTVTKRTGVAPDAKISQSDLVTLTKLVSAISFVENGIAANEVDIEEGKKLLT